MLPTLTSHRLFHEPAVMTSQSWWLMSALTPSRVAISFATSTSKPFHWLSLTSYQDWGLYFWSVATRIAPALQIAASASVPLVSTDAQTPAPVDPEPVPLAAPVVELLAHAAPTSAKIATTATRWNRNFRIRVLLPRDAEASSLLTAGL